MAEFFTDVTERIPYEGPDSDNPLAFHWYDADRVVAGRRMEDHLRFAVCYWHSFNWDGFDIFGAGTLDRPWHPTFAPAADPIDAATPEDGRRVRVLHQARRALLLLPRPRHRARGRLVQGVGGAARRDGRPRRRAPGAHRRAAAVGHGQPVLQPALPGRRGDQPRPRGVRLRRRPGRPLPRGHAPPRRPQLRAVGRPRGLRHAAQHRPAARARPARPVPVDGRRAQAAHRVHRGDPASSPSRSSRPSTSTTSTSPPCTPSCSATTWPTRSRSTSRSTTPRCRATTSPTRSPPPSTPGSSGRSTPTPATTGSGWDVDRFPVSVEQMALGMLEILRGGGFTTGGLNFDAKLRRQSIDRTDLFHGHIGGMDTMARALLVAASVRDELDANRDARYAGWDGELGRSILDGTSTLADAARAGLRPRRAGARVGRAGAAGEPRRPPRRPRPLMPLVAGVDSSTTATKVEVRELDSGRVVGRGSAPHPPTQPPRSEQDPAAWWAAFESAWRQAGEPDGRRDQRRRPAARHGRPRRAPRGHPPGQAVERHRVGARRGVADRPAPGRPAGVGARRAGSCRSPASRSPSCRGCTAASRRRGGGWPTSSCPTTG